MRDALQGILPFLAPHTVIVEFSKGIDDAAKTTGELIPELLPQGQPFAVAGGPMLAEEISAGKNAVAVIASMDDRVLVDVKELLSSVNLRVETSHDILGVSLAGVLKNMYAVALGAADELALGDNEKGWLAARAQGEMAGISHTLGGDIETMFGTAGLADFIATAYSPYSQNRTAGEMLARRTTPTLRGEGLLSLPQLLKRLGPEAARYPLLGLVKEIGLDGKPVAPAFAKLFQA